CCGVPAPHPAVAAARNTAVAGVVATTGVTLDALTGLGYDETECSVGPSRFGPSAMPPPTSPMNTLRIAVTTLVLLVAAPVFAQGAQPVVNETLGVTITAPEGWELVKTQGNDKSLANFRHPESQSH